MKARAPWRVTGAVTASALALLLAVEGLTAQAGDLDPPCRWI